MRLLLNYILISIVFLYNSSCHSINEANLSLVSTDENSYNNNYELPKILYKGEFKYVIPQKRWLGGKLFYSVDTLLSRHIENHIRETHRFTEDVIYKFHVRLKIDDKGNVFSVNEIGDDLKLIFNDKSLKQVFVNDIFEYIKTISFLPAQINKKNVSCEIDLYLHINPYGLGDLWNFERDHQGSVRMVRDNSFGVAQSTAYTASGLPVTHIYSGTGDWHLHTGKSWQDIGGLAWYDNRARWYDPITMRFLAPDPLADKYHDISPWAWCGNNPLRYSDPSGMVVLDSYAEENYPKFTQFMKSLNILWLNKRDSFRSIFKEYSGGLNDDEVSTLLTYGEGPLVKIGENSSNTIYGESFTINRKEGESFAQMMSNINVKIEISPIIEQLVEYSSSEQERNGALMLLEATLFHEFTHQGNSFKADNPNGVFAPNDSGMMFEIEYYGEPVQFNNFKEIFRKFHNIK